MSIEEQILDVLTDPRGVEDETERKLNYVITTLTTGELAEPDSDYEDDEVRLRRSRRTMLSVDVAAELIRKHNQRHTFREAT